MNTGGQGTADSHWRDSIFNNELMTGFLNSGTNPLSRITAASMQDMGYPGVNYDAADNYNFSSAGIGANNSPVITGLTSDANPVFANQTINLSAAGVSDAGGSVASVRFFVESNGIPGLQFSGNVATFDTLIGTDTAGATYSQTYTIPAGTLPGSLSFYAHTVDNVGLASAFRTATVTVADGNPPPSVPDLQASSDTGVASTDDNTADSTPTFIGTTTPGGLVTILADNVAVGTGVADGSGNYSITTSTLTDGIRAIRATVTVSGNTSVASAALNVTIDTVAPTISSSAFLFESFYGLRLTFSETPVGASSASISTTNTTLNQTGYAATFTSLVGTAATFTYALPMPDGNYNAAVAATNVSDVAGNPLAAGVNVAFFVLAGDVNRDRVVGFDDLLIVAQSFGTAGRTWSTGDLTFNGAVDFSDLLIVAQAYGNVLA
jgi:Bacterial Ig-like domain/Leishmanolysin